MLVDVPDENAIQLIAPRFGTRKVLNQETLSSRSEWGRTSNEDVLPDGARAHVRYDASVAFLRRCAGMPALALLLVLVARDARADDASLPSPYRLKWAYDSAIVALGAAGTLTSFVGRSPAPGAALGVVGSDR